MRKWRRLFFVGDKVSVALFYCLLNMSSTTLVRTVFQNFAPFRWYIISKIEKNDNFTFLKGKHLNPLIWAKFWNRGMTPLEGHLVYLMKLTIGESLIILVSRFFANQIALSSAILNSSRFPSFLRNHFIFSIFPFFEQPQPLRTLLNYSKIHMSKSVVISEQTSRLRKKPTSILSAFASC